MEDSDREIRLQVLDKSRKRVRVGDIFVLKFLGVGSGLGRAAGGAVGGLAGAAGRLVSNTGSHSRQLGRTLEAAGLMRGPGQQAAHIVPTNLPSIFRPRDVRTSVALAHERFDRYLPAMRDSAINGFWAAPGRMGAHTNVFFRHLGGVLGRVESVEAAEATLIELLRLIQSGHFL